MLIVTACVADEIMRQDVPVDLPGDSDWHPVPQSSVPAILQMLADQSNGNYERIRTWQGICRVDLRELRSREYVAERFHDSIDEIQPLIKHSVFVVRVAIDFPSNSIYRSKETKLTEFVGEESGELVKIAGFVPADENSTVTSEHYLHLPPNTVWPSFGVLPDYPDAQNKRAAFREPVAESGRQEFGDLVDPRGFFGFGTSDMTFGRQLEISIRTIAANDGQGLKIYEATRNDESFYRIIAEMGTNASTRTYLTSVWTSAAGYNPISMILAKGENGGLPIAGMHLRWIRIDGICVPSQVRQARYLEEGKTAFQRDVSIEDCILNRPLDPHQFDCQGLGLKDGELVIDKIENAVYVMKNGTLTKLADFGARYIPPEERLSPIRGLLIVGTIVLIAVLLVLIWRRRTANV